MNTFTATFRLSRTENTVLINPLKREHVYRIRIQIGQNGNGFRLVIMIMRAERESKEMLAFAFV